MKYEDYQKKENDLSRFSGPAYSIQQQKETISLLKHHLKESQAAPKDYYTWYNGRYSHALHLKVHKMVIKEAEAKLQELIQHFENIK